MRSNEDTLWLSELCDDTLRLAKIWPTWMLYIAHPIGISLCYMTFYTYQHEYIEIFVLAILGLLFLALKCSDYLEDITLIKNEIIRRELCRSVEN